MPSLSQPCPVQGGTRLTWQLRYTVGRIAQNQLMESGRLGSTQACSAKSPMAKEPLCTQMPLLYNQSTLRLRSHVQPLDGPVRAPLVQPRACTKCLPGVCHKVFSEVIAMKLLEEEVSVAAAVCPYFTPRSNTGLLSLLLYRTTRIKELHVRGSRTIAAALGPDAALSTLMRSYATHGTGLLAGSRVESTPHLAPNERGNKW